jgi:tRNA modification GTPase
MAELPMTAAAARCAVLTPPGRGAIATISVWGPGAIAAVAKCFRPASGRELRTIPVGRVVFGRFFLSAGAEEELVVGLVAADRVEVHCHGGPTAAGAVVGALVAAGCQEAASRDYLASQAPDPIAAAALAALASARTQRVAGILLDQYHGALRCELQHIRDLIGNDSSEASQRLQLLLSRCDVGQHLTRPWRVVLTGAPNVGKSSLINALLGYQRAIVFDQPGTTRDVLTATTALDGWPVELADTAGLRAGGDAVESEGVSRALRQIAEADLVVQVVEAGVGGRESGVGGQGTIRRPILVVHNKCDLPMPPPGVPGLIVSAKTGQGIDRLGSEIAKQLVPAPPPRGAAVPFTEGQIAEIRQVHQHLDDNEPQAAIRTIESLLLTSDL